MVELETFINVMARVLRIGYSPYRVTCCVAYSEIIQDCSRLVSASLLQ